MNAWKALTSGHWRINFAAIALDGFPVFMGGPQLVGGTGG
jgi:hypothetical protein